MKAMILAAGMGTRLRPLSENKPKALVPIVNIPIIQRNIDYLRSYGVDDIIVNAHYLHVQMEEYLEKMNGTDMNIEIRVEPEILGTGGGLKNTRDFWDDRAFLVINSDILVDINLEEAYLFHEKSGGLVTLILHDRDPFNQIKLDHQSRIIDIGKANTPGRLAFTGIHIMDPKVLAMIPDNVYFDIIELYRRLIREQAGIVAFVSEKHYWMDIGTRESYVRANLDHLNPSQISISPESIIADSAGIYPYCIIGRNCILEEDVEIKRSILWDNVHVKNGVKIADSIVTSFKLVEANLLNQIY